MEESIIILAYIIGFPIGVAIALLLQLIFEVVSDKIRDYRHRNDPPPKVSSCKMAMGSYKKCDYNA